MQYSRSIAPLSVKGALFVKPSPLPTKFGFTFIAFYQFYLFFVKLTFYQNLCRINLNFEIIINLIHSLIYRKNRIGDDCMRGTNPGPGGPGGRPHSRGGGRGPRRGSSGFGGGRGFDGPPPPPPPRRGFGYGRGPYPAVVAWAV